MDARQQAVPLCMQEASVSHYRAFISTAACLARLQEETQNVGNHVDAMLQAIPSLAAACDTFSRDARGLLERKAANKQLRSELLHLESLIGVHRPTAGAEDGLCILCNLV